ncbi:MAG: RNA polymerase sigma factor RpoD, partial [Spirochaetaceae bacterium]|nr:RNA polymerase sigma factor RpoD [Spirochaetaceae bacterium]
MTSDLQGNPEVEKLLQYAKNKKAISFDEVGEYLPDVIINPDKLEELINLLAKHNISINDGAENLREDEEVVQKTTVDKRKKLVSSDKESTTDDPIRLYLREIGKENLLTAEQEVELSKKMEEGENIIENVIKNSGMLIPEFYYLAQRTFSKRDPRDMNLSKKEASEYLAERRRLQCYREPLREIIPDLKAYIEIKRKLIAHGSMISDDAEIAAKRTTILAKFGSIEVQQEEILQFSEKFLTAAKKIKKYKREQEKIEKRLRVSNSRDLRGLGRGLTIADKRQKIEEDLGIPADEIKEEIRQIQVAEKKLKNLETEFEDSIENIQKLSKEILRGK